MVFAFFNFLDRHYYYHCLNYYCRSWIFILAIGGFDGLSTNYLPDGHITSHAVDQFLNIYREKVRQKRNPQKITQNLYFSYIQGGTCSNWLPSRPNNQKRVASSECLANWLEVLVGLWVMCHFISTATTTTCPASQFVQSIKKKTTD